MTKLTYLEYPDVYPMPEFTIPHPMPEFCWGYEEKKAKAEAAAAERSTDGEDTAVELELELEFIPMPIRDLNLRPILVPMPICEVESKIAECDVPSASLLRPGLVRRLGCGVSLPPSLVSLNP